LARAIAAHPELELVAQASNGIDALAAIERFNPDVALVDVRMPGIDGLDVCDRVTSQQPPLRTRMWLVTTFPDEMVAAKAATAGAAGLLGKESSRAQLCLILVEAGRAENRGNAGRTR
jgi:DNA-binding NarL/FixJ family response regulator